MAYDPLDSEGDPFKPPSIPTTVFCLHCQQEYDSYRIEWRVETAADGSSHGFWCCPIPGCDGKGFGFDIFPIDRDYRDENTGEPMWCSDDGDDDEDFDDEFDQAENFDESDFDEPGPEKPESPDDSSPRSAGDDLPF